MSEWKTPKSTNGKSSLKVKVKTQADQQREAKQKEAVQRQAEEDAWMREAQEE